MDDITQTKIDILSCRNCDLIDTCRSPVPFSVPPEGAKFIVIGQAPSKYDDLKGEPWVGGPSARFLRQSLLRVGLDPADGAYMHAVACRTERPLDHQIDACFGNVFKQIKAANTPHILTCGSKALQSLIPHGKLQFLAGQKVSVQRARNSYVRIHVTYHPSYILKTGMENMWMQHLVGFMQDIRSMAWLDVRTRCIYCKGAVSKPPYLACRAHSKLAERDLNWWGRAVASTPVDQPTLWEEQ